MFFFAPITKEVVNRILNLDFRKRIDLLNQKCVIISDPPFNINYHYETYHDKLSPQEYLQLLRDAFAGRDCVIIHYPEQSINLLPQVMGSKCVETVAWVYGGQLPKKHRLVTWWGNLKPDFKRIRIPYKYPNDKRTQEQIQNGSVGAAIGDWWEIPFLNNVTKKKLGISHPCPLPDDLVRKIIILSTNPGDTIIDPFCGIGTIPRISAELGRNYIGFEINPSDCDYMKKIGLKVFKS